MLAPPGTARPCLLQYEHAEAYDSPLYKQVSHKAAWQEQPTTLCEASRDEGAVADEEAQDGGQQHLEGALLRRAQHLHDQRCDGGVHDRIGRGLAADDALQVVQDIHLHTSRAVDGCLPACQHLLIVGLRHGRSS